MWPEALLLITPPPLDPTAVIVSILQLQEKDSVIAPILQMRD